MRRLSCDWPIYLTVFAFILCPMWNIFFVVLGPEKFNAKNFLEDIRVAVFVTTIVWLIYGVACLLAKPLRDPSEEEPWKPGEDFHIEVSKDENQDVT